MPQDNMDNALSWFFKKLIKWGIFVIIVYVIVHFVAKVW